jgi:hypothetical protein
VRYSLGHTICVDGRVADRSCTIFLADVQPVQCLEARRRRFFACTQSATLSCVFL